MSDDRSSTPPARNWMDKLFGAFSGDSEDLNSRDELMAFLRDSTGRLKLDQDALTIIEGALHISDKQVREILIPRSRVVAITLDQTSDGYLPLIQETGHSRYPVIGDNIDDVKGILLVKDLLPLLLQSRQQREVFTLDSVLRPAMFIPESKRLNSLLKEFRDTHNHMAVVVDEYGGTAGIITIEDILEQIVGDIEDEHDSDGDEDIRSLDDGGFAVRALTSIDDFNERFATTFADDEFDTLGGLLMRRFGHLPRRGEQTRLGGWHFTVLNADNRRIRLLDVRQDEDSQPGDSH
ncbi:HlyC/CorC family transporter [Vreelandella jeotgali]|uniref:HlyC/CorC family transporter n=1 Tax=Vreelandella jeotgali TaxID=553386 RepID=UPI000348174D|nr:transporter associated domain-containing protein [Halomonas jeotgali]